MENLILFSVISLGIGGYAGYLYAKRKYSKKAD